MCLWVAQIIGFTFVMRPCSEVTFLAFLCWRRSSASPSSSGSLCSRAQGSQLHPGADHRLHLCHRIRFAAVLEGPIFILVQIIGFIFVIGFTLQPCSRVPFLCWRRSSASPSSSSRAQGSHFYLGAAIVDDTLTQPVCVCGWCLQPSIFMFMFGGRSTALLIGVIFMYALSQLWSPTCSTTACS